MNDDFPALVRKMRDAQRIYFKHRTRDALMRSKELEQMVDAALEDDAGNTKPKQDSFL
jgi:alcohol dehydrogenase class IV